MEIHGPTPQPSPHRPLSPGDLAVPSPVVAEEPGELGAALVGIEANDNLARKAGVNPAIMLAVEEQEWGRRME